MSKIIAIEDDDNLRELVCYALSFAGFEVIGLEDGKNLNNILKKETIHLIILDIMLPGDDGLTILNKMKSCGINIPVIMLTAKGSELDRVKGLDLGADDYITKPFSVMELISRVKAVLRRCISAHNEILKLGDLIIYPEGRKITLNEQDIILTYKEFELLLYLANNKGIVLSRDKIMENVWGFEFEGESRTVDMHIKTLRQKLGHAGDVIKTVRNVGYKIEV